VGRQILSQKCGRQLRAEAASNTHFKHRAEDIIMMESSDLSCESEKVRLGKLHARFPKKTCRRAWQSVLDLACKDCSGNVAFDEQDKDAQLLITLSM
jgi:hypothetical protein